MVGPWENTVSNFSLNPSGSNVGNISVGPWENIVGHFSVSPLWSNVSNIMVSRVVQNAQFLH